MILVDAQIKLLSGEVEFNLKRHLSFISLASDHFIAGEKSATWDRSGICLNSLSKLEEGILLLNTENLQTEIINHSTFN